MLFYVLALICLRGVICADRAKLGQGNRGSSESGWSSLFLGAIRDVEEELKNGNLSDTCKSKVEFYLQSLAKFETWAFQVLDSVEKLPSGILSGNSIYWPGKFDECLGVTKIKTQYCLASFQTSGKNITNQILPSINYIFHNPVRVGICVPAVCDTDDVTTFIQTIANVLPLNTSAKVVDCQTSDAIQVDSSAVAIIVVLLLFVVLLLLSTVYDLYSRLNSKQPIAALCVFSAVQNGTALFSTKQSGGVGSLHGLRFLSMAWIILLHTFGNSSTNSWNNFNSFLNLRNKFLSEIILNSNVAVDTFYCMSGLLVSYIFMKKIKGTQTFNVIYFYIHRYMRLTPVYAIAIGVAAGLLPFFGSGPLWPDMIKQSDNCKKNWWLNLLYASNIFDQDNMCQPHCWFLASDMQMYLISPLILYPLYRYPRVGWTIAILVVVSSSLSDGILTYVLDLPASAIVLSNDSSNHLILYYQVVYMQAYSRLGPYVIGILTGYILSVKTELQRWMNKTKATLGWILASACNLSVLFGLYRYVADGTTPSFVERCLYSALSRSAWAAGIAYIVIACAWGYGGVIDSLLSWNGFLPLGRLTYCAYIIHYNLLLMFFASRQSTFYYDFWIAIYIFAGILLSSYLIAMPFTLVFEMPVLKLEKLLLRKDNEQILKKNCKTYDSTGDTPCQERDQRVDSETGISNAAFEDELKP